MCNNELIHNRLLRTAEFGEMLARVHRRKGNHIKARTLTIQSYTIRLEVLAMKADPTYCGDIGKPIRHVELPGEEPLTVPEFEPEEAPAEPAPERVEPEREPEKVPA